MTNAVREFFDFAMNEPESVGDMFEIIKGLTESELREVEKIAGNALNAVRSLKALKMLAGEKNK